MPNRSTPTRSDDTSVLKAIAHHDAEITSLSNRMAGVEEGVRVLQGEVHRGFTSLSGKLDRIDAAPKFDFHKTVATVTTLAVLFSLVVGGIIWITTSQFSGTVVEQKAINAALERRLGRFENALDELGDRVGWAPKVSLPARR